MSKKHSIGSSPKPSFQEAVDGTRLIFEEMPEPEAWNPYSYDIFLDDYGPPLHQARIASMCGNWGELIEEATIDRAHHIGLRHLISEMLDTSQKLPPELKTWLVQYLLGLRSEPKQKGGAPPTPRHINLQIYERVLALKLLGFNQKRSYAIVAKAGIGIAHIPVDAETVRRVCENWGKYKESIEKSDS